MWFGESLLENPVYLDDVEFASPVDLLRILDYPNDFVPVISRKGHSEKPGKNESPSKEPVRWGNKKELTEGLARNAIVEMLDRLGLR